MHPLSLASRVWSAVSKYGGGSESGDLSSALNGTVDDSRWPGRGEVIGTRVSDNSSVVGDWRCCIAIETS